MPAMSDLALSIPILDTERLRLRSPRASDFEDYAAMYADREVLRYLAGGPEPWDRGRSWRQMALLMGHWQLSGVGMWAVEHRESGAFIGMIGFAEPEGWPGFELAWALARRWWGHGYATEGARAALAHGFTALQKDRIISLIHPENRASIRVAERIGESLQGRIHHFGREMLCYGIDRNTYLRQVAPATSGLTLCIGSTLVPAAILGRAVISMGHPLISLGRAAAVLGRAAGPLGRPFSSLGGAAAILGRAARPLGRSFSSLGHPAAVLGRAATPLQRAFSSLGRANSLRSRCVLKQILQILSPPNRAPRLGDGFYYGPQSKSSGGVSQRVGGHLCNERSH